MYKFINSKGQHLHTYNNKPLMGVTTILSVISKPALIQWSANMAVDYIRDNVSVFYKGDIEAREKLFAEAKVAHRKKKEKSGDWGTKVHRAVEMWIKKNKTTRLDAVGKQVLQHFKDWAFTNNVKFIESEKNVYSKELGIGGIVDLVIEINGRKFIGDIKTSSGIYQEAFYQMGAYHLCLEQMKEHKDIEGYIVINLKKDGTIAVKQTKELQINKDAFYHALKLYSIINKQK